MDPDFAAARRLDFIANGVEVIPMQAATRMSRMHGIVRVKRLGAGGAFSLLAATRATAHPGHGLDSGDVGLLHFLLDLSHGGAALLASVVVLAMIAFFTAAVAMTRVRRHG
jgi:hypothetical protein